MRGWWEPPGGSSCSSDLWGSGATGGTGPCTHTQVPPCQRAPLARRVPGAVTMQRGSSAYERPQTAQEDVSEACEGAPLGRPPCPAWGHPAQCPHRASRQPRPRAGREATGPAGRGAPRAPGPQGQRSGKAARDTHGCSPGSLRPCQAHAWPQGAHCTVQLGSYPLSGGPRVRRRERRALLPLQVTQTSPTHC